MKMKYAAVSAALLLATLASVARAEILITEWAYSVGSGEYIEFTNVGNAAVDMTGWSFDDDSQTPGVFSLSGFGLVAPGESVVITESAEAAFRASWALAPEIKVLGGYTNNLGRNDEINLFDSANALADRLTFGDQSFPGTIRTQDASGNPITLAALGANDVAQWQLSVVGDAYGSYLSSSGDIGNPGIGTYVVPEPSAVVLMVLGGLSLCVLRMKRNARRTA
jgi:predicted extracellular nuclease